MRMNTPSPELLRELRDAGLISASNCDDDSRPGIVIRQVEGANVISETSSGLVSYVIQVRIASSLSKPFTVSDAWIETPWGDYVDEWLPDPGPDNLYQLTDDYTQYPREDVLNHRDLIIRPGRAIRGIFLGMGTTPTLIPRSHNAGEPLKFIIENDFGKRYSEEIFTSVDRTARCFSRPARPSNCPRIPLFERDGVALSQQDAKVGEVTGSASDEDQRLVRESH